MRGYGRLDKIMDKSLGIKCDECNIGDLIMFNETDMFKFYYCRNCKIKLVVRKIAQKRLNAIPSVQCAKYFKASGKQLTLLREL